MDATHNFHSFLREKKIGGPSTTIPEEVGRFRNGVPNSNDLILIPDEESFPLKEQEQTVQLSDLEFRHLFAEAQLEAIHADSSSNANGTPDIVGPILEIPGEFDTVDDYIQFKRELATVFKKRSEAYEWPQPVGVCYDPLCMNSTAPGFKYCLYHISKDEKYESLGLIGKCQVKVDGHDCPIPCGIGESKCAFHRQNK
ncbi:hypothetical protein M9Y10_041131 [Tritrichomonas musculus]|uniref:Potential DNA-binding domain-containing protein n=1 Tax=Tritrichomonas musculus TaxID=1915356 RepID=A0ABR2K3L2_9EUKA